MSTKVKLISAVMALIIVTSIMIVGVMALSDVTFNMSGTVNFVVVETDVFLNKVTLKNTVTQTPNGYQANDVVLEDYSNMYLHQGTSIDLSEVTVLSGQTMEIDFDMTSLNENYLKVMLNYSNLPSTALVYLCQRTQAENFHKEKLKPTKFTFQTLEQLHLAFLILICKYPLTTQ